MIRSYSDGSESPTARSPSEAVAVVVPGLSPSLDAGGERFTAPEQLEGSLVKSSNTSKAPRIVPCLQCRTIRRSCSWIEGQQACARCSKLAKACSGPSKRPRELLEVYKRAARTLPSAAPSSPTSQMASVQLSYALTYHLVDLFLEVGQTANVSWIDTESFARRFRETRGRASGLSEDDEVLTFVYMLNGAQISNHSAIFGQSSSTVVPSFESLRTCAEAPNISKIGLARRDSLMAIAAALTTRIRTLNLNDGRSLAGRADRLALVCLSVSTYIARDLEVARHFWLGQLVAYALSLMGHPECHGALRATMTTYIQGLARAEVRASYANGWVSSISANTYSAIFGPPTFLPPLPRLSPTDITLLLGDAATPSELDSIVEAHSFAVEAFFDALGQTLVYAPPSSIGTAVRQCWDAVDGCAQLLRDDIRRILEDSRYATLDPEARRRRPGPFLANAFAEELMGSLVVCGCHLALFKEPSAAGLLLESEERLCHSLSSIAESVSLMLSLPSAQMDLFVALSNATSAVGYHRAGFVKWVRERPQDCFKLLPGLRIAAYGHPDAAQLVQELEDLLAWTKGTDFLAASMVDGVLAQLAGGGVPQLGRGVRRLSLE